jgi:predicted O-methyltransferase YrrM
LYQLIAYIKYWLLSVDEHSLHSPFLYKFYSEIIQDKSKKPDQNIEAIRNQLLKDETILHIEEMGAGSRVSSSNSRKLKQIAKHASTPLSFSLLLAKIIKQHEFDNIVELGTSLGSNTAYLALARPNVKVTTFEGSESIAKKAQQHFSQLNLTNIEVVIGNIDETLAPWIEQASKIDLAYLDANHRYDPTIRYFDLIIQKMNPEGIIVLDDIHWSKEMNQAWHALKNHASVSLSIDLFEGGILFLNQNLPREEYILSR